MRHHLTWTLMMVLAAVAIALIVAVTLAPAHNEGNLRELAAIIYPPLITLGATSFAWFFATNKSDT